ncbi:MAG TPA: polysaccharide deacetylase family protein, partial [Afipia sp.]
YLASKGIMTWSADFLADDWRHISSARVAELAIRRLKAYGRGVLLLHDIQARTQAALPTILRELKAGGYRIVHVVPSTPELPKTPTEPEQWQWRQHRVNPAMASLAPGEMHFVFDPPLLSPSDAGLRRSPAEIATSPRPSVRGDLTPIWRATSTVLTDDAAIRLLAPAPDTFEFSERALRLPAANASLKKASLGDKASLGTPQE